MEQCLNLKVCFSQIKEAELDRNVQEFENSCSYLDSVLFVNLDSSKPVFNLKSSGATNDTTVPHYINASCPKLLFRLSNPFPRVQ